ncbi:MAG: hypothetical protein JEZ11_00245 [Desulfobacterales bacterium]|nr:hypothetical protein [Desulfobacterales bacterium]
MESMLLAIFHIAFVSAVYCAAYRQGLRASEARTRAIVEQFNYPLEDLVEKLNREVEKSVDIHGRKDATPTEEK